MLSTMYTAFPIVAFFDLGPSEMMVIGLLILVLFGKEKLPGFARGLGKAIREFKKASSGVEEEIRRAMAEPPPSPKPPSPIVPAIEPSAAGSGEIAPEAAQVPSVASSSVQTTEGENDQTGWVAPAAVPSQIEPAAATPSPSSTDRLPQKPEN
ncbi:MAG: twin-arginine translocase TatA/TatE family subunit [Verrucomicrobiota bacterium]